MRDELEILSKIDSYLNGTLEGEELARFEADIKKDPSLALQVHVQKQIDFVVASASYSKIRSQMSSDINALDKKDLRNKWILWSGIAILFVASLLYLGWKANSLPSHKSKHSIKDTLLHDSHENSLHDYESLVEKIELVENTSNPSLKKQSGERKTKGFIAKDSIETNVNTKISKLDGYQFPVIQDSVTLIPPSVMAENSIQKAAADCGHVDFKIETAITPTCAGEGQGQVIFTHEHGNYGKLFYAKLNDLIFAENNIFYHLQEGESTFVIKNEKGCSDTIQVLVPVKVCKSHNYILNTTLGETWRVPAIYDDYILKIYSKSGREVYIISSKNLYSGEWNGMDMTGNILDAGIYAYTLEYKDGSIDKGQISIVK